ncbi:Ubiquitin-conjugating enzyme family protein [Trichomonas vaginalis G3]|uniref:E2 ubiquitin-conjugating enzyme n=1 Tax=Trichomonas vaginalis (strain ATCC PRA-98 / G3) TaxID=412133 RepID=A2F4E2_TRIV3|nr:protein modification by small protein conjugation [Trichomonas vaginalis G3]EAY00207.1 Ubiquitin-conjugating enzyme family protein [Trichomonas vaginalis G3]KAI5492903.1 protein modification by small protein conjugation [Trichomonas vaginalis G3]|eukprot:XP_001313136.1 Ubiquitin-conjugating enzyme family protein [Trichomonas vaginalis G3]
MASLARKIGNELKAIQENPNPNYTFSVVGDDITHLRGIIHGPADSPYAGGNFTINISVPPEFPLRAPAVTFGTKIYHPNVNPEGNICLSLLKNEWSPKVKIMDILEQVYLLISAPDPIDALNTEIAAEYKDNHDEYVRKAKQWTQEFAHE